MTNRRVAETAWKCWTKDDSCHGWEAAEWHSFHHATQNSVLFKMYEIFISGIFHFVLSDHGCVWVIETTEKEGVGAAVL